MRWKLPKRPIRTLNKYMAQALTGTVHDLRELNWRYGIPLALAVGGALYVTISEASRPLTMMEQASLVAMATTQGDEHGPVRLDQSCGIDCADVCVLGAPNRSAEHTVH